MESPGSENQPRQRKKSGTFSIQAVLVVTSVLAVTAASLGQLFRAANGDPGKIGQFVIMTAMLPTIVLLLASVIFKLFDRIQGK